MILKIFMDKRTFESLKATIPPGSDCHTVLEQAVHFSNIGAARAGRKAVVICNDVAARKLLSHARNKCPGAATTIAEAFRAAGLNPTRRVLPRGKGSRRRRIDVSDALDILQSAVDRCGVVDIRTADTYTALTFLERRSTVRLPFNQFRSALEYGTATTLDKNALWELLNASLDGIRRSVGK